MAVVTKVRCLDSAIGSVVKDTELNDAEITLKGHTVDRDQGVTQFVALTGCCMQRHLSLHWLKHAP